MADYLPGAIDQNEVDGLIALVIDRALPQSGDKTSNGEISREDVLQWLGVTSMRQLFPAPRQMENLSNPIKREQHEALLLDVLANPQPTIVHAPVLGRFLPGGRAEQHHPVHGRHAAGRHLTATSPPIDWATRWTRSTPRRSTTATMSSAQSSIVTVSSAGGLCPWPRKSGRTIRNRPAAAVTRSSNIGDRATTSGTAPPPRPRPRSLGTGRSGGGGRGRGAVPDELGVPDRAHARRCVRDGRAAPHVPVRHDVRAARVDLGADP